MSEVSGTESGDIFLNSEITENSMYISALLPEIWNWPTSGHMYKKTQAKLAPG